MDTPCHLFTAQIGSGNEKYTADAITHEVGHTPGLDPDSKTDGTGYYQWHGDWAPMVEAGYYKEVTLWSKSEHPQSNKVQDDLNIISTYVMVRNDDPGDWRGGAT